MIHILLVEDNELARAGTAALIGTQTDMKIVGEAGTGAAGLELYRKQRPHIAIVDLRMPSFDGVRSERWQTASATYRQRSRENWQTA